MSFTNDDKKYIQDTVGEAVDSFARIVGKGFEGVDKRFEKLDGEVQHINATLSVMSQDVAEIKKHFVYRYEFEDLMARVKYLETKLNINSGK